MNNNDLTKSLVEVVGKKHVICGERQTERFRKGFRSGEGDAIAVVRPGSLTELWAVLKLVVQADKIIIMQAANTGLTEGSTPKGQYDRDVVVINTLRLKTIQVIQQGKQIISHPGGTLFDLEKKLRPYGREPHSNIGSACIGASIIGGVCNNSGGSLVQRGPVYTELSLYAELRADGTLALVNHLGMNLGDSPEEILRRLDSGDFSDEDILETNGQASASDYQDRVKDVDANSPARFNADPKQLYESSGCAGKLAVFAARLDTFPKPAEAAVYYVGTNNTAEFTELRRRMLTELPTLPISGEYLHRECFDIARRYGKDTLLMIDWLGTEFLPLFFSMKGRIDATLNKASFLPSNLVDKSLQVLSRLIPEALPKRLLQFREQYEHHLIVKVEGDSIQTTEALLNDIVGAHAWFKCNAREAKKALLHRFAAAGAAVRYEAVHENEVETIIALDIALRRNDDQWLETLPDEIEKDLISRLYYGHFFCHVFHQDYVVRKGVDAKALKMRMLELLDTRGAEYPAEHNVGHLYKAKPALANFYQSLDPTNSFNPGLGKTSREKQTIQQTQQQQKQQQKLSA